MFSKKSSIFPLYFSQNEQETGSPGEGTEGISLPIQAQKVQDTTQKEVEGVLSNSGLDIGKGVNVRKIDEINHKIVQEYTKSFLFIEFPGDETHTSIIHSSTLSDGREIYTIRFGIGSFKTQRPAYDGLAVVCRNPDGTLILQRPISKNIGDEEESENPNRESAQNRSLLSRYKKQLHDIGVKMSTRIQDGAQTTEALDDLLISEGNRFKIYDISDNGKPDDCHFFIVFVNKNGKKVECQISVYKRNNTKTGAPEDIIEVHSLVRDNDETLLAHMYYNIFKSVGYIHSKSQEKGLLKDIDSSTIRLTRDEKHDTEDGSERVVEIPYGRRDIFLRTVRNQGSVS